MSSWRIIDIILIKVEWKIKWFLLLENINYLHDVCECIKYNSIRIFTFTIIEYKTEYSYYNDHLRRKNTKF